MYVIVKAKLTMLNLHEWKGIPQHNKKIEIWFVLSQ